MWVKSATLAARPSLPIFPYEQTSAALAGMSQKCPLTASCAAANSISNRQSFDRTGASLRSFNGKRVLWKFHSLKATHQLPFCSHF